MKSKTFKILAIALAAVAAFGVTAAAYDSSEDPIVSLSYLTKIFKTEIMEEKLIRSILNDQAGIYKHRPER